MRSKWIFPVLVLLLVVPAATLQAAAPPRPPELQAGTGPLELIVLLASDPGVPTPEEIVEGFSSHQQLLRANPSVASAMPQPLPGSLATGSPVRVYYAVTERAKGEARQQLQAAPNGLRAILERYLVLSYPPGTDLDAVKAALAADPNVLHVEENLLFEMAVTPSDPYFSATTNPPDPTKYQWGSHTLQLDQAWNWTTGHAYVGLTDVGLQMNHPDLQANFRPQFSRDIAYCSLDPSLYPGQCDGNVDEVQAQQVNGIWDRGYYWDSAYQVRPVPAPPAVPVNAGHGTHTSGIIAATANNGIGVAGACWNCSLMMAKIMGLSGTALNNNVTYYPSFDSTAMIAAGIVWLVDHGAQVISASLGTPNATFQSKMGCADTTSDQRFNQGVLCNALAYMDQRDVTMFAASGNDELDLQFPASDSRVISAGGIDSTGSFWQPYAPGSCPSGVSGDCGSNWSVTWPGNPNFPQQPGKQILVTPAVSVVSTIYQGRYWIPPNMGNPTPCYDSLGGGYGVCTGTSMSSPYAAGVGALVRSVNPLLTKANVADVLERTASNGLANWNQRTGYGIPNASAAVQTALGTVAGRVLVNRLTPLFSFYSSTATSSFYTTAPQMATAALFDPEVVYASTGKQVPLYPNFPGVTSCTVSPCPPPEYPGASVYIFTTEYAPY
ncbi:MAG TPA: S8 family serine peptidase, partial [Thermoanaerobaculia bacterium]|nr:S8 family serine peptidase [Thermoanaerobaculia bacterium]